MAVLQLFLWTCSLYHTIKPRLISVRPSKRKVQTDFPRSHGILMGWADCLMFKLETNAPPYIRALYSTPARCTIGLVHRG